MFELLTACGSGKQYYMVTIRAGYKMKLKKIISLSLDSIIILTKDSLQSCTVGIAIVYTHEFIPG